MLIRVSQVIGAPVQAVWDEIARLESHAAWMADVVGITMLTDQQEGVGTLMEVRVRVGPLRTSDVMELTVWDPPRRMGIRHIGLVRGSGLFELTSLDDATTRFAWTEELDFPLRFGGPIGVRIAAPLLAAMWRRNLRRLAPRVERTPPSAR